MKITNIKNTFFLLTVLAIASTSCSNDEKNKSINIEKWKKEIVQTEADFAKMVKEEGMNKAFLAYAADEGVIMRNNRLFISKDTIGKFFQNFTSKGLAWKPDFVDVSTSGDLGYTYGYYTFTYPDSTGTDIVNKGVFHTVWKRQEDNTWKFVWD